MPVFTDQLNRAVNIRYLPKRIISLVPSQTELLLFLGLDAEILGITKFCIHPADQVRGKAIVGGTKHLDMAVIHQLRPDLIIANKEENEQGQIDELTRSYPVWISDINDLATATAMITAVGALTGKVAEAEKLNADIGQLFERIIKPAVSLRTAYFIWRKPYMAAGQDTFINSLLELTGFTNVFNQKRYPEIAVHNLIVADPEVVLLSSEPYPFKEKHLREFQAILPNARVILVDGEMFSWYGSRLLQAPMYFERLISNLI